MQRRKIRYTARKRVMCCRIQVGNASETRFVAGRVRGQVLRGDNEAEIGNDVSCRA
jgi:hypothetical protein